MSFIFAKQNQKMKKIRLAAIILSAVFVLASCTTYRGSAGGGCQMNRNLVGYK